MTRCQRAALLSAALFTTLSITPARAAAVRAQCVDSSEVFNFKVRSIKVNSLFGAIPQELRQQLERHRGEPYSADKANEYAREIEDYIKNSPVQEKYERLVANKLKLSVRGVYTELECVAAIEPAQCQAAFTDDPAGPVTQCVDVTLKRYEVAADVLNSSPYFLLFPRSTVVALYGAVPRPLLFLNPSFDAQQDRQFGPAAAIDTATDLLDLPRVLKKEEAAAVAPPLTPLGTPTDNLEITSAPIPASATTGSEPELSEEDGDTKLMLRIKGRKSLSKAFYDTSTGLALARTEALKLLQNLALETRFDAHHLPHGNGDFLSNAATLGFGTSLRLKSGPVQLINLGGGYRWSRNRFFSRDNSTPAEFSSENGFHARAIADGQIKKGLARAAVWFDGGDLNRERGAYRRVVATIGYGKEFVLPRKREFRKIVVEGKECWSPFAEQPTKNEQTIGFEVIAGAGRAWGETPEYARFFGGAPPGNFLYDELSAQTLIDTPAGPPLRSVRQKQAGVGAGAGAQRGGTSFWHVNVNVSLPVAKWSRPLIPPEWVSSAEVTDDDDEELRARIPAGERVCRDLKRVVKDAVGVSGVNLLIAQRARDQLTEEQKQALRLRFRPNLTAEERARLAAAQTAFDAATARVTPEVQSLFAREILPITNFIADHANLFSVKPLFLFDAAHIKLPAAFDHRVRYGAGGGLQIDAVLARFEFGYVFALNRLPGDGRGNLVGRLVFKRFF